MKKIAVMISAALLSTAVMAASHSPSPSTVHASVVSVRPPSAPSADVAATTSSAPVNTDASGVRAASQAN